MVVVAVVVSSFLRVFSFEEFGVCLVVDGCCLVTLLLGIYVSLAHL